MTSGDEGGWLVDESQAHVFVQGTRCITTDKSYLGPLICEGLTAHIIAD